MAEPTEASPKHRLSVSPEATQRELRLCAFAVLDHYLSMHQVIAAHLGLEPVALLILITTTTGNVQRALRSDGLPGALRGSEPLPPGLVVPMSRRAIARVTGIPTESVRRHVDALVRRGLLVSTPKGVHAANRLTEDWALAATLRLVASHATCTERLMALEAIVPVPTRAGAATRK